MNKISWRGRAFAGCATGEEAYSLDIILREYIDEKRPDMNIQIFATDLDEDAIQHARAGLFSADIAADVNSKRLKMFFQKENNGFSAAFIQACAARCTDKNTREFYLART